MTTAEPPVKTIDGRARTVRELLDKAKYAIDFYQREYAWQERQVRELIDDLTGYPPVAKHFYPITRSPRRSRGIQAASACGLSSPPVRLNHPSNRS